MRFLLTISILFVWGNINSQIFTYFSSAGESNIQRTTLEGLNREIVVDFQNTPRGLAIDYERGKLFFSDGEHHSITRANLDGTNIKYLIGVETPIDLFLDKAQQLIFFTDLSRGSLSKMKTDGTEYKLLNSNISSPAFLDVDLISNSIYVTSNSPNGRSKIYHVNLDGTDEKEIYNSSSNITGVAVDPYGEKLYWLERGTNKLFRSDLDGNNSEIIADAGELCIALELDDINGKLYWSDKDKDIIYRTDLNGNNQEVFLNGIVGVGGIAMDIRNVCTRVETIYDTVSVTDSLFIDLDLTQLIGISKKTVLRIFPNPTHDIIHINSGMDQVVIKDYTLNLISESGRIIWESQINKPEFEIDLSSFGEKGLYLLSILDENQVVLKTKKIILH